MVGGALLLALVIAAVFAPVLAPHDPLDQDLRRAAAAPDWHFAAGGHFLGTDSLGRDVLSRLIWGSRVALIVALVAGSLTALLGTLLGLAAGFFGGSVDAVISRLVDVWMSFPPVLLSIVLVAVLGTGLWSVVVAIVVIDWTRFCRVVRAETLKQERMDYVAAASSRACRRAHPVARGAAQRAAADARAADAGDGHRRGGRGDPVLRRPVDLLRHAELGRHDRRGALGRASRRRGC